MPHKILSSFAIAFAMIALAGCSSPSSTEGATEGCTPAAPGAASDGVEVEGELGSEPTVTIDGPLEAPEATERTVNIEGDDGERAESGTTVSVQYSLFNGTSGESIETTSYAEGETQDIPLDQVQLPGLRAALECSAAGERITAVIPPVDAFGEAGQESLGLAADDSLVFVIDVVGVEETPEATPSPSFSDVLPRADGVDQPLPAGFPAVGVALAEDGAPTITIPDAAPPADLQIAVLKQGAGAVVAEGATVVVHYTGVLWETGEVFDSSWAGGEPVTFSTDGVIQGFSEALVGKTVGSQVLAVIPPSAGYGDNPQQGSSITPTSNLVFVLDILATQ